ncbi:class I SAM-dependent methyltransferase [Cohnella cholangitidis]|uniref:class I SAM-dependent methyltransferase n=1 Tax=Cohnella cholangitidis TaxID=2598458 RepID=UPI0015FE382B|nr:SAM-dependent methyltransferase [Cohnella cholangitidis]
MADVFSETPLTAIIRDAIKESIRSGKLDNGEELSAIPFHQYMKQCLYHHEFGYYRSTAARVGREGDFYTSAYIGELMGEQLASEISRMASEWFARDRAFEIMDWGGGTGRLSRQMLDEWETRNGTAGQSERKTDFRITLVEDNPGHQRVAREQLADYIIAGKARVVGSDEGESLLSGERPIFIVANELLDAFPTYRLVRRNGCLWEWGVACVENKGLTACLMEPVDQRLETWVQRTGLELLENQSIEVNLDAADWAEKLAGRLGRGMLLFVDYGDETEELLAPHRMDGTLLCYRNHKAHNNPYEVPGEQDLTSHVNFSHVRQVVERQGWKEQWYGTQKRFLIESGIMSKLSAHTFMDPFHPVVRRNRAIRQLLLSDGMSELFKVQLFLKTE